MDSKDLGTPLKRHLHRSKQTGGVSPSSQEMAYYLSLTVPVGPRPGCDNQRGWLYLLAGGGWNVIVQGRGKSSVVPSRSAVENGAEETAVSCLDGGTQ